MTSQNERIALVDGDFIAYRCAASCEPNKSTRFFRDEEYISLGRASDICNRIGDRVAPTELRIYLGGSDNFRKSLDPMYKANRLAVQRPMHLEPTRDFLVRKWGATILTEAYEVDDRLGMEAAGNTVICAIDKDLQQIPGEHYNPVKDIFTVVDAEMAAFNLYSSMLIGDTSDNLRGIDGIGPVKAGRLLGGLTSKEMHLKVQQLYDDAGRDFFLAHRLFGLLRTQEEFLEIMSEISISKTEGTQVATVCEGSMVEMETGVNTQ